MKNKTKTYVLLVAVLMLWGIIGYKIISALNPDAPPIQNDNRVANFNPTTTIEVDTFSIQPVDRDPFLGTIKQKTNTNTIKTNTTTLKMAWPQITYGGLVKQQNTNTQIFVLNINNKQYLLKSGQEVDDVTLLKGNSKAIEVRFNNQNKTFALHQ